MHRVGKRFTPTRVGNTSRSSLILSAASVHPHACGEYVLNINRSQMQRGSPPRVWGIPLIDRPGDPKYRFTPTRVGNTERALKLFPDITVHPHACGEYLDCELIAHNSSGSPPRVWGILRVAGPPIRARRFTPTRVGNTCERDGEGKNETVHPHACGEYRDCAMTRHRHRGSPPRVWGIRQQRGNEAESRRFTPTRVGNTNCRRASPIFFTVHPHACGEYPGTQCEMPLANGSPPRVWGIRGPDTFNNLQARFTPTRVGNTQ